MPTPRKPQQTHKEPEQDKSSTKICLYENNDDFWLHNGRQKGKQESRYHRWQVIDKICIL